MWPWVVGLTFTVILFTTSYFYVTGRRYRADHLQFSFDQQRSMLQEQFVAAHRQQRVPPGLELMRLEFDTEALLVTRPGRSLWVMLVGVQVEYRAIPGSAMEGVTALGQTKIGCVRFDYARRGWTSQPRVYFNLSPRALGDQLLK